jgi:hypothetical protein
LLRQFVWLFSSFTIWLAAAIGGFFFAATAKITEDFEMMK